MRFNTIFDECQVQRNKRASKEMEDRIKIIWHDKNPVRVRNDLGTDETEAEANVRVREEEYVPRTDFDLE